MAAVRIQRLWRGAIARNRLREKLTNKLSYEEFNYREADMEEAALVIQTRARIVLSKNRVRKIKEARRDEEVRVLKKGPRYDDPIYADDRLFFPPNVHQMHTDRAAQIFYAIDLDHSGVIPRRHAFLAFRRLVDADLDPLPPEKRFDLVMGTHAEMVTLDEFSMMVSRVLNM